MGETPRQPPDIGPILRQARTSRGLTLEQLAELSKVSKSMLSQVERGEANPTFAVLWAVTQAMGIDFADITGHAQDVGATSLIEINDSLSIPVLRGADGRCSLRILSPPRMVGVTEWYDLQIESGGTLDSLGHAKGSTEHLTILNGEIGVEVDGEIRLVRNGEVARYPVDRRHKITNSGPESARALMVLIYQE